MGGMARADGQDRDRKGGTDERAPQASLVAVVAGFLGSLCVGRELLHRCTVPGYDRAGFLSSSGTRQTRLGTAASRVFFQIDPIAKGS